MPAQTLIAFLVSCFDIRFWRSCSIIFYRVLHTKSNGLRIRNGEGYLCFGMMHCTIHSASYMHPQLHFWCRKLSSIVRTLCTNQYIPSQKCFVCTRNNHQDSSDWKRWRSIDFSEEESHRGPRKKQTFAVAQLSQVMLMICLSQSINLSRQNQRFTTQNHEWCIEPMRCCHAVLPHVLVWRTIG